jgi:hypothetical protein
MRPHKSRAASLSQYLPILTRVRTAALARDSKQGSPGNTTDSQAPTDAQHSTLLPHCSDLWLRNPNQLEVSFLEVSPFVEPSFPRQAVGLCTSPNRIPSGLSGFRQEGSCIRAGGLRSKWILFPFSHGLSESMERSISGGSQYIGRILSRGRIVYCGQLALRTSEPPLDFAA